MERYLSIGDAAKRLGVVPATVKAMVGRGRLRPAARTAGGIQLFAPADVERLAAERAGCPEPENREAAGGSAAEEGGAA